MAATKIPMSFKKGDNQTHYFQIDEDVWSPGGQLHFTAKPAVDNDNNDSAAVINKSFGDSAIVGALDDDAAEWYAAGYVTYRLSFVPGDIVNVSYSSGEKSKKYLGEFSYNSSIGEVESCPNDDNFIEVTIYADIRRAAI